ncbi:HPr kinase/phosphorylase [Aureimonas sp. AU12]|uniref:HPr kinase/phosphorylase n=1 Tax=Aureimonas sp. AU12 TaxID=1638161 RepID=UPI00078580EB|nr:hypothetical protein [Aureimonas sp. AU12]
MSGESYIHATAVMISGSGLLIRGLSGSGKSSLALSLLQRATALGWPAHLVADDQVMVRLAGDDGVSLHAPETIAGLIELRGIGLLRLPYAPMVRLDLVIDLVERETIERLPDPTTAEILGRCVRRVTMPSRDPAFGADLVLTLLAPEAVMVPTGPERRS